MTMLNFRRVTSQKRFIPQIDGLRFVAISVVLFHLYASLNHDGAILNSGFRPGKRSASEQARCRAVLRDQRLHSRSAICFLLSSGRPEN